MKRLFIITTVTLTFFSILNAQSDGIEEKIKAQLNSADKKNYEKAEESYNDAAAEIKLAEETESVNKNKAFKIKLKALRKFGKANKIVYRIYKQDLTKFFNNIDPVKKKKAELKVDKAGLLIKEAKQKREASVRINVLENACLMAEKADDFEKKALKHLTEVYEMFIGKNTAVGEERPVAENDEGTKEVKSVISDTENKVGENKTTEVKVDENKAYTTYVPIKINGSSGVFFLIQVAASKTPISEEKLKQSYKEIIHGELVKDWYRYVINEAFTTLEEAENYKKSIGIRGTLIIAIKNGQKVSIPEALKKEEVKQKDVVKEEKPIDVSVAKIIYRLEIGISTSKLSAAEIRNFKNGGKAVMAVDRGGWYSYTIGDFDNDAQAQNFKRIKGLSDAIVLKLKDGKVID